MGRALVHSPYRDGMTFATRGATVEDAATIARIHVASWQRAYAGLMPAAFLAGLSTVERETRWRELLAAGATILLVTAPEVVGFAAFGPSRDDPPTGQLFALYLDPPWWGRGAGRVLHDAAVERLDAAFPRSVLWVLHGNDRATRFYRAAGWVPDGRHQTERRPDGLVLEEDHYVRASLNPRWLSTNPSRS